jgi:hypothetical protein
VSSKGLFFPVNISFHVDGIDFFHKIINMGGGCWIKIIGVFCISCAPLLAHIERSGEEGAPEAIVVPLRLISRGVDDVQCLLNWAKDGHLYFVKRSVERLMRNERLGLPLAERFQREDTWDHCLVDFVMAREFLFECMRKVNAMVALAQAVRDVVHGGPDRIAEGQQNYEELCREYNQNRSASSQQIREEEITSWVRNNL